MIKGIQISLIALISVFLLSCGGKSKNNQQDPDAEQVIIEDSKNVDNKKGHIAAFDINAVPISNVELEDIPYLSAPKGYEFSNNKHERKYEEKLFFYNDPLVMTIGGKYYHTMIIPKRGEVFSETYLVKSFEEAIKK